MMAKNKNYSASSGRPRAWRSAYLWGTLSLGLLGLASCGPDATLSHNRGGAFTALGFDEATLGSDGTPRYLSGRMEQTVRSASEVTALLTQGALAPSFRLAAGTDLTVLSDRTDENGLRFIKLQQLHQGVPVIGRELVVQLGKDGAVEGLHGHLQPALALAAAPAVDGRVLIDSALADLAVPGSVKVHTAPSPAIYIGPGEVPVHVYQAKVEYLRAGSKSAAIAGGESESGRTLEQIFVSATSGAVVARHPLIYTALAREIYDLKKTCLKTGDELPGTLLFKEGGMSTDMTAQRVYDNTGSVYWYFKHEFQRTSYDDKDAKLMSSVHGTFDTGMGCSGDNAAWIPDPYNQMVYGDGSFGIILKDLSLGYDVAAHELTHAVTSVTSNLVYMDESGAINEAMSDVLGAAAEAWKGSGGSAAGSPATITVNANTWKIGEDVAGFLIPGGALRFMNNPTADMVSKDYYPERIMPGGMDNGGVHINSGLGNLAFYLLSEGGKHPRSKTDANVKGIGIVKAMHIFYLANTTLLTSMAQFQDLRYATAKSAEIQYGRCSQEWLSVHQAWDAVAVPGDWALCSRPRSKF
jgi:bacillolysin